MLKIKMIRQFEKDLKKLFKRGYNIDLLNTVIDILVEQKELPLEYKDHKLIGNHLGYRECHILTNGFIKKTQKTPKIEIFKALKYKEDYEKRYKNEI